MKLSALPALALLAGAAPQPELQKSSAVANKMGALMELKTSNHEMKKAAGVFAKGKYAVTPATTCKNGKAGEYGCQNADLAGHLTHDLMGSTTREGNDIWGWTSDGGREFALVGQTDGTAFVEVLPHGALKYIGRLPTQTNPSIWRDMKVIGHHVYIGSEAENHGLQIFDLTKLLTIGSSPKTFDPKTDLTAWYSGFGSSHNIVANPETNMIYAVGASNDAACPGSNGGPIMLDVKDPSKPTLLGCAGLDNYCHDAQAVLYHGVDKNFHGHEILLGHNERCLTIYDVTDKKNPAILSRTFYDGFNGTGAYTHQGWTIDKDMKYLLLDDELDEQYRRDHGQAANTRTYVIDLSDLTKPKWTGLYQSPVASIDHNQYVVDGVSYQANYASGLRIVDVSKVAADPTGGNMRELAHFDCYPEDDAKPAAEFNGAWSVYPWFKSGTVVLNCIERGMFALKVNTGK